ncbi:hypothetical protein EDB86DRAFT_2830108 [Lactarius hatsudake]|nr:hypothetical protein EDB86DRAFT_2830108 [Lactarius hatsudake]
MMNSLRTPFGFPRFSTSIASDPEAQRQATFADHTTDPLHLAGSFCPTTYPPLADLTSEDEEARLPSYSEHIGPCDDDKPFLLAKFLFKYGFVFPPFWFLSILISLIPLTPPPTWELDKSPVEHATLLRHTRATERLWAHRSLCAAGIFSGLVTLTVAIFMVAMHAT